MTPNSPLNFDSSKNLPDRMFVIFCRIVGAEALKVEEVAGAYQVLQEFGKQWARKFTKDKFREQTSVYGRIFFWSDLPAAYDAVVELRSEAAKQGVLLAISMDIGSFDPVDDFGVQALRGPILSRAARMAKLEDAEVSIVLSPEIYAYFGQTKLLEKQQVLGPKDGTVKRTKLTYHVLRIGSGRVGDIKAVDVKLAFIGHVVVYDLARFSEGDRAEQKRVVDSLMEKIKDVAKGCGLQHRVEKQGLWYSPAGDGGVLVFSAADNGAISAWTFARSLAEACLDGPNLRVAVGSGMCAILDRGLPVGSGVLEIDDLCAEPEVGQILLTNEFRRETVGPKLQVGWAESKKVSNYIILTREPGGSGPRPKTKEPDSAPQVEALKVLLSNACKDVQRRFETIPKVKEFLIDNLKSTNTDAAQDSRDIVDCLLVAGIVRFLTALLEWAQENPKAQEIKSVEGLIEVLPQFGIRAEWIKEARETLAQGSPGSLRGGTIGVSESVKSSEAESIVRAVYDCMKKIAPNGAVYRGGFDASAGVRGKDSSVAVGMAELRSMISEKIGASEDIAGFLKYRWRIGMPVHILCGGDGGLVEQIESERVQSSKDGNKTNATPIPWDRVLVLKKNSDANASHIDDANEIGFFIRDILAALAPAQSPSSSDPKLTSK